MSDTPKHWKQYLEHLEQEFKEADEKWTAEAIEKEAEYEARPWYQKIMHTKEDILMWHEWERPTKRQYEPSLVDYYNWDVKRKKKKNVRT